MSPTAATTSMSSTSDVVEASPDLPTGWASVRVAEAGAVRLGRQRSPDQSVGDYPTKYVRAANITRAGLDLADLLEMNFTPAERQVFALQIGDILLTEASGSPRQVGRAAIWQSELQPCCYQNTVIRFRPHLTTPGYALLVFRHMAAAGVFAGVARGVGIQHLGATRFAELPLPLPPAAEQMRIVEIANRRLAEIREADHRLRSALDHLDEQRREILAAAVAGKLVPQEPETSDAGAQALRPAGTGQVDLFERDGTEPDLDGFDPALPAGWRWQRVDRAGDVTLGRQRSPQHERGQHMRPYLRVANVYEDRIDTFDVLQMNFEPSEATIYALREGDVLLNEGQSPELVGRPAIYRGEVPGACFQNTLIRFRSGDVVSPEFALLVFRDYMHSGVFRRVARWSTNIAHLGLERFRTLPFPVPPREEQDRIVAEARRRLDATQQQVNAVRASLDRLPIIERELLAAAVAGELAPQDPSEEPASALRSRLGAPPQPAATLPDTRPEGATMASRKPRPSEQAEPMPDLAAVLRENGGALPLPDLFALAGYNRDLPEHVELFYLALRSTLGETLCVAGDATENAQVEIADAA